MTDIWFLDGRVRVHLSATESGGLALLEATVPPGSQPPLHVHRDEDEGFYVLEGELTIWAGEDTRVLRPGEFHLAPRAVPHTIRAGADGGRYLVAAGPRFEAFVRAVGTPARATELPSPDRLATVAAEHGIELLGAPGTLPADLAAA